MIEFKQFLIYKFKYKFLIVNTHQIITLLIFIFCTQTKSHSFVDCASLVIKPPTKCGEPGVPSYGKLLTNNLILSSSTNLFAKSPPPNLITNPNDFIVSNNSEISIDMLNFNNALDQNQVVYEQGEIVSYSCFVGHLMIGSAHRKCLPNGRWSGNLPICDTLLDQFDLMKSVESSNQSDILNNQETISTLTAQAVNYLKFAPPELAIDHRFSTCFHSEKYGPRMLRLNLNKSMRILGVAITVPKENLDYDFSVYISNSKQNIGKGRLCLTFRGTFATKTTILLCQATTQGDRINIEDNTKQIQTFSICEVQIYIDKDEIECGEPEIPTNGLIVSRTRSGQIEYQCKLGYYLTGSVSRQCQKNGLYSGEQAICNEIQCKEENNNTGMDDQRLSLQISAQLHSLQLSCEPGYQFAGIRNHSIVCLGDGRFDTRITPLCESIDCGSPLYISEQVNGEFVPLLANKTTYGSTAKLRCFDSQSVYSSDHVLISCESSGQWSIPKAICIPDPLRPNGQTRQLKNRLGTIIVSVLLVLVLLILLLTIYLFKKRILLLAMNENKLTEANLRRNVQLISTNNDVVNSPNLMNAVNRGLFVDVESSSISENNSSQPSSKISIQRLFRRKSNSVDSRPNKFFNNLIQKAISLKCSMNTNKLSNYVNCCLSGKQKSTVNTNEQYTITNQFLHSQLNPIFIDQLDCQDTSIKECAFRQYSSTLKSNQISLVRLANQQRTARLIKASNYQFNQFGQINQFVRHSLTSSMKSDSFLIGTRRQLVRDRLIKAIKRQDLVVEQHQEFLLNKSKPSSQLSNDQKFEIRDYKHDKEGKQFYYFAQHCLTLPHNHSQPNHIERLMQTTQDTFVKSSDVDILNTSDSASNSSDKSSSYNSKNSKDSTNSEFINQIDLDRKPKPSNRTTITVDIHSNKNLKKPLNSTAQTKTAAQSSNGGQNANDDKSRNLDDFTNKSFENECKQAKLNRLTLNQSNNMYAESSPSASVRNSASNLKYIVIDDTVFAD